MKTAQTKKPKPTQPKQGQGKILSRPHKNKRNLCFNVSAELMQLMLQGVVQSCCINYK
jgi:hypothetical protein